MAAAFLLEELDRVWSHTLRFFDKSRKRIIVLMLNSWFLKFNLSMRHLREDV